MNARILLAVVLLALNIPVLLRAETVASMLYPAPGSTLAGGSQTFSWSGSGASEYFLFAGSSQGGNNYFGASTGTSTAQTVSGLPTDGTTVYVRLWTRFSSAWYYYDYTYRATVAMAAAAITSPSPGSTLAGSSQTFAWAAGSGALEYFLYAGNSQGGNNYFGASTGMGRTQTVSGLPTNGSTIYVRVWTRFSSGWNFNDYTFRAATVATQAKAIMTSPSPGSTFAGGSQTFSWNSGSGALEYVLDVGSSQAGYNYYGSSAGISRSVTVNGLPTNGSTVYVRLWTRFSTGWDFNDYTYRAVTVVAQTKATMTVPVSGSTLTGSTQTFSWNSGSGALEYFLFAGSSPGTNNYFSASAGTAQNQMVSGLPTDGSTVYVRLSTRFSTGSDFNDYTYRAAAPKVLLFLHGMNSSPGTWNTVRTGLSLGTIPPIYNGAASAIATKDPRGKGVYAYAVAFGAFDVSSGRRGLEGTTGLSNYKTSGDFESFDQLGSEVNLAVTAIRNLHQGASIVLVAHSRGGLAGRAFLQQAISSPNKSAVKGFVTTGTPHLGSRLGRLYTWLAAHPRDPKNTSDEWKVADFLNNPYDLGFLFGSVDIRRPTIGDISDGLDNQSVVNPISLLNSAAGNLPSSVSYYGISYNGYPLGTTGGSYSLFDGGSGGPRVGTACRDYILGQGIPPSNYTGDGIVPASSQTFLNKANALFNKTMAHIDETNDFQALQDGINFVSGGWLN